MRDLRRNGFMSTESSSRGTQPDFVSAFSGSDSSGSVDSQVSIGDWECIAYNPKLLTAVWLFLDGRSRAELRCASLELKEDLEVFISRELV